MAVPAGPTDASPRDRYRAQVRGEVKRVALEQLATGGAQAVSVNAIARELDVSGPALYRYFANRDDLLTDLIVDAYDDLATAVATATWPELGLAPPARFRAFVEAYRVWGVAEPHRYRLLFRAPLPGYDAQDRRLVEAARAVMDVVVDVLDDLVPADGPRPPVPLEAQFARWARDRDRPSVRPAVALAAVRTWIRLHGLVSLEIEDNLASMGLDPAALLAAELSAAPGADHGRAMP